MRNPIRQLLTVWAILVLLLFALGMRAHAQGASSTYKPGQPPRVTQLPEGTLGDALFLTVTQGANPPGYYACPNSSCTPTTGWVCMTCGGGGFTAGGDLTGTSSNQTVRGLQTVQIDPTTPTADQLLIFNNILGKWKARALAATDIPSLDASKITTGTFTSTQIPTSLLASLYTFAGEVRADFFTSTSTGESYLQLSDNTLCTLSPGGKLKLCSQGGALYLSMLGAAIDAFQMKSQRNVANGYAGLGAGGFVGQSQLGSGSGGAGAKCLTDNQTYQVCAAGGTSWPLLAPSDGTAGAPVYSWNSEATSGLYRAGAGDYRFSILGTTMHKFSANAFGIISATGCYNLGLAADLSMCRNSAAIVDDRFGTGGGERYIFGTRTDASNWEALTMGWDGATRFRIAANRAGTGNYRTLGIWLNGSYRWIFTTSGNLFPNADNSQDFGSATGHVAHGWFNSTNSNGPDNTEIANDSTVGTTLNQIGRISSAGKVRSISNDNGVVGPVQSDAGTIGNAQVCSGHICTCSFSGGTTAGDWVIDDPASPSQCKDVGWSGQLAAPTHNTVMGIVLTTNGGAGNYQYVVHAGQPWSVFNFTITQTFCSTTTTQFNTCTDSIALPSTNMPDTNYTIQCTARTIATGTPLILRAQPFSSSAFTLVTIALQGGTAASLASVDCTYMRP